MTTFDSSILSLYANIGSSTSTSGTGSSLLSLLYNGGTTSAQGMSSQSPVDALLSAQRNQTQDVTMTAQQPQVKSAIAAFTKAVNSAPNLTAALDNPAVMNVLLTANGMTDQIGNTALAVKAITSNLNDPGSLANQLTDTRWKTLAGIYDLASNGLSILQNPKTIAAIAQGYAQMTWENNLNTSTPGLSDALNFIQQAGSITSVFGILGNQSILKVVETATSVPQQIAFQSLNAQEAAISSHVNVSDFQNPSYVQSFAERFLIMNNLNNSGTSAASTNLTTLSVQAQTSSIG